MDCRTFQERLADLGPDAGRETLGRAAERHLAGCPRCRELDALVRSELELAPVEPPADLADAVLRRTSGEGACAEARAGLCDLVDGALRGLEARLVEGHVEHCPACGATGRVLARLGDELPELARLEPAAGFADAVLARTLPLHERLGRRLAALGERWQRVVRRPRFGLEAAYVGAAAVWALFGLTGAPLAEVPDRALTALQQGPAAAIASTTETVHEFQSQLGAAGRKTLEAPARHGGETLQRWSAGVSDRYRRTSDSRDALRRHGGELGRAALYLDLDGGARAAQNLGAGLGRLWRDVWADPERKQPEPRSDAC